MSIEPIEKQEACAHIAAGRKAQRCPECRGFLRRCCQSTMGCNHEDTCPELAQARVERAKE
jgi:hypothetical protein